MDKEQRRRYEEILKDMAEPIMPSQISNIKMDLQGLMKYAESKGKQVIELSDDEKAMFIKEKDD